MAASVRETERKYDLDEDTSLPELSALPGVDTAVGPDEQLLEAVYFDTDDLRLAAAGITLRRRRGGTDSGWHLKLPVAADSRDEIRVGFGRGQSRVRNPQPPAELVALTRAFTRGAPLGQVTELTTRRLQWRLTDGRGRDLAELVDDHVTAQTLGSETEARSWREVEVELAEHGDTALLDRFERRLRKAGIRRSDAPSKLVRALGDRLGDRATGPTCGRLGRKASLAEVALTYLSGQVAAVHAADPAVRRDLPDAVHAMRVATRRLRSTLQAYRDVLDREATDPVADELAWLASVLGTDRDLEVLEERITRAVAQLPDELVLGHVGAQVTRFFTGRRATARAEVIAVLDGDRYLALLATLDALLVDPPLTTAAGDRAGTHLHRLLGKAYRRVERHVNAAHALPLGPDRDAEWHEARKAAKRLRYATEAAAPVLGKPARKLIDRVKAFQELLGDHQDAAVARPVLRELAAHAHLDGENGFTFGILHEQNEQPLPDAELTPAWLRIDKAMRRLRRTR